MGKLIEEAAALAAIKASQYWNPEDKTRACRAVQGCPAVDAVPVIRCKDCKYYSQVLSGPNEFGSCKYCIYPTPDDFCSHGEPVNKPVESVNKSGGVNNGQS